MKKFYNHKARVHSVKVFRVKVFWSSFEYIMQQTEHSDNIFRQNMGKSSSVIEWLTLHTLINLLP